MAAASIRVAEMTDTQALRDLLVKVAAHHTRQTQEDQR